MPSGSCLVVHLSAHLSLFLAKGVRSFLATAPCPSAGPRRCLTEGRRGARRAGPIRKANRYQGQGLLQSRELGEKGMMSGEHSCLCLLGRQGGHPHLRKHRTGSCCGEEGPSLLISLSLVTFHHGSYHSQGSFPKTWASVALPFCLETSQVRI